MAALPVRPAAAGRMLHLDNLKVVLTAGVIVAHAAMTYGAVGTWVYEEPSLSGPASAILGAYVGAGVLFGLGLFFLVSGVLTTAPLQRRGPRRFLTSRLWRLGVPLVLYATVVWPVLRWLVDRVEGDTTSLAAFYRAELSGDRWQSLGTGPLWFVAILLVVSTAWSLWRWGRPAGTEGPDRPIQRHDLALAAGTIATATFLLRCWFPVDSPQVLDVHVWMWPQAATLFVLGAVAAERGWLTELPLPRRRDCHRAIAGAVVALIVMIPLSSGPDPFQGGWHWEAAGFAAFEGVFSVSASLVVLDRFRRRHARQGPLGGLLARSSYGAFVSQGPVLVLLALALRAIDLSGDVKFLILAPAAVAMSYAVAAGASLARASLSPRSEPGRHDAPLALTLPVPSSGRHPPRSSTAATDAGLRTTARRGARARRVRRDGASASCGQ